VVVFATLSVWAFSRLANAQTVVANPRATNLDESPTAFSQH
jgi:hypothetical protein